MVVLDEYRFTGLAAICLLALGLAFVVVRWPKGRHFTFSQHVAARKVSTVYYSGLFLVVLPLLMAFFALWFVPRFHVSNWFFILTSASSVAQIICTFMPERGAKRTWWHRLFAGISGLLLLPSLSLLLLPTRIDIVDKYIVGACLFVMMAVISVIVVRGGRLRNSLILQCVYFTAFFLPVLVIAYL